MTDTLIGDEGHYLKLASRIRNGWYTNSEELDLWYGPGYPIFLSLLTLITDDIVLLRISNALLMSSALILVINAYREKLNWIFVIPIIFTFFNFSGHMFLCQTITEALVFLLLTAFVIVLIKYKNFWLSGAIMGFLALTKVVFFYLGPLLIFFLFIKSKNIWNTLKFLVLYLVISTPYLIFTKGLTGKFYYPGTSGGLNLYWQATSEYPLQGEWQDDYTFSYLNETNLNGDNNLEKQRIKHAQVFESIKTYNPIVRDSIVKNIAVKSIINRPVLFIVNSCKTLSRMFFNFPMTQKTSTLKILFYVVNGLFQLSILTYVIIRWKELNTTEFVILIWVLAYIGLHVILNGLTRQYYVITPVVLILLMSSLKKNIYFEKNKLTECQKSS